MSHDELRNRNKQFAMRVIALVDTLPRNAAGRAIGNQLIRSGTSVGVNYRAACRAKSRPDFISKMGTVEEEADESMYWMELIVETGMAKQKQLTALMKEADEIVSMTIASIRTARMQKDVVRKVK
jgi:four helix bundle protein